VAPDPNPKACSASYAQQLPTRDFTKPSWSFDERARPADDRPADPAEPTCHEAITRVLRTTKRLGGRYAWRAGDCPTAFRRSARERSAVLKKLAGRSRVGPQA
jgi:hypothetical protein